MKHLLILLFLITSFGIAGCESRNDPGGNNDPPPPALESDYEEQEPNDFFDTANFITLLPIIGNTEIIEGHTDQFDADFFYFYLNPNPGAPEILLNVIVETELFILAPKIRLLQTIYDEFGEPTDTYSLIGQYVGVDGELVILDAPVPYDSLTNNDLYIVLESYGVPIEEYKLEFWTW